LSFVGLLRCLWSVISNPRPCFAGIKALLKCAASVCLHASTCFLVGMPCCAALKVPASTCCAVPCCPAESSSSVRDECLLWGSSRPEQADIIAALNEAARVSGAGKQGGLGALLDKWQTRDK
jgi:hypothetical protein